MFDPYRRHPQQIVHTSGCLVMALLLFMACLLPWVFVHVAHRALENLHLSPAAAWLVLLGSLLGSLINLPIVRYPLNEEVEVPVFEAVGWMVVPTFRRLRREMIVAVNVGGCVVPVLLCAWLIPHIVREGTATAVLLVGLAANTAVCWYAAQPIPRLGIALPFFLPALVSLSVAWLGLGAERFDAVRAPVAFVIGVSGPLLGADLLHWRDFPRISAGVVSIGGAGTWDGIVLSGLLAALLA